MTPQSAVDTSLRRIDAIESKLQAWVEVDRDARADAKGLLAGVPVGIKDIFDVAGLPTRYGAASFAHHTPAADSVAVSRLRAAGAAILGKTHTTQFAYMDPAPTRNPWNLNHTPGGSSSGSAAAVAAGMVPLAIGSQTVGSVLRPAAYCGIVGFKPTYGRISNTGVGHLAPSFDHVGTLTRTVADAALALKVLAGYDADDPYAVQAPVYDYTLGLGDAFPVRLALIRSYYATECSAEASGNLDATVALLRKQGIDVTELDLGFTATDVSNQAQAVLASEAAAMHATAFATNANDYGPNIRERIESGSRTLAPVYIEAVQRQKVLRRTLTQRLEDFDAFLLPTIPSPAPDLSTTGNSIFNGMASFSGLPAIALPSGLASNGLPLSVQLIGAAFDEATLLALAALVEAALPSIGEPPL
jgi:Asp-tRNA(Asn)/Glu-tRNA(Gln) amidotransferase A subunit family amidase